MTQSVLQPSGTRDLSSERVQRMRRVGWVRLCICIYVQNRSSDVPEILVQGTD